MCLRRRVAVLAPSGAGCDWVGERTEFWEASWTSRPVVKALGPAPERMMARVEGQVERWVKRGGSSCHILFTIISVGDDGYWGGVGLNFTLL